MEKYAKAQMEVIEFENEDVITTSGVGGDVTIKPWECGTDVPSCPTHCSWVGEAT